MVSFVRCPRPPAGRRPASLDPPPAAYFAARDPENLTYLPRGGVHVQTKYGAVQFGIPPETVKDSIRLGLELPSIFIVPKDRFNLKYGTNTSEVEFPAYMNFFVKGRSTCLVCTSEAASVISKVVDEVLEGPEECHLYTDEEYSTFVNPQEGFNPPASHALHTC